MKRWALQWWDHLRIQHKVWAVLLLMCLPLIGGLATHLYIVQQLLSTQQQRHELILARGHVELLRRLAIDIEDGFRGYVLTQQPAFLAPLTEAESRVESALTGAARLLAGLSGFQEGFEPITWQLKDLLRSKHALIADIQRGNTAKALAYIRLGEGLRRSDRLRQDLQAIEDRLELQRQSLNARAEALSQQTFVGLWVALVGVVFLGWISSRMLACSLTDPITRLQSATARLAEQVDPADIAELLAPARASKDELGQLAEAYLLMARRIGIHIQELEVLNTIGQDINTIGPDGLDGVLHRISDRAVELVCADVCLVLIRNERMGCWIVEAASGEWSDRLANSVMLWDELPISVQAYETREVAIGEGFRADERPQVLRRNLLGDSMLAVPLLAQGEPFGVLALVCERPRSAAVWNQRLAKGLAQEAALAISNVKLYEAAQQQQRGLVARLRQLEHLAETLAHDLKGPGARMGELARLLVQQYGGQFDDRTKRWFALLEENSKDLVERVEGILSVARVGTDQGAITAVDPTVIIGEVLKARAGEIEQRRAVVHVDPGLPLVACHAAYLRQIFDNLISNALKFTRVGESPVVRISGQAQGPMAMFSVEDQGTGIPLAQRTRVFQPFVRLLTSQASGSGIGLTIIQRIVDLYGGKVWVDGAEGVGCTVQFTIPSFQEQEGADARMQALRVSDVG
ncbi:MAG: ATP-binding protein [Nitrospirota bacterium]|nr:ATP-binding protein [Nitrospirota bacterium]